MQFTDQYRFSERLRDLTLNNIIVRGKNLDLVNRVTIENAKKYLQRPDVNPNTATIPEFLEYLEKETADHLTLSQKLNVMFIENPDYSDPWDSMMTDIAVQLHYEKSSKQLGEHPGEYLVYRALEGMDQISKKLYDIMIDLAQKDYVLTEAKLLAEARDIYKQSPYDSDKDEILSVSDVRSQLGNVIGWDLVNTSPDGNNYNDWYEALSHSDGSYDDICLTDDTIEKSPEKMLAGLEEWGHDLEEIEQYLSEMPYTTKLEANGIVVPNSDEVFSLLQKDSVNQIFTAKIPGFKECNAEIVGACIPEHMELEDHVDESYPLKTFLSEIEESSKKTFDLVGLSIEKGPDNTSKLSIKSKGCSFIPESYIALTGNGSRRISEIDIDPSVQEIGSRGIRFGRDQNVNILRLPENIQLYSNGFIGWGTDGAERTFVGTREFPTGMMMENMYGFRDEPYQTALRAADIMDRNHVPITPFNVQKINDTLHSDIMVHEVFRAIHHTSMVDAINKTACNDEWDKLDMVCQNYMRSGLDIQRIILDSEVFDPEYKKFRETKDRLSEEFRNNFHGRVPRVIDDITVTDIRHEISGSFADHFDYKALQMAIKKRIPFPTSLPIIDACAGNPNLNKILLSPNAPIIANVIKKDRIGTVDGKRQNKTVLTDKAKGFVDFAAGHPLTNMQMMNNIASSYKLLNLNGHTSMTNVLVQLEQNKAIGEIQNIKEEYPDFDLDECECALKDTDIHQDGYYAHILKADDTRQVMLGYDTDCCQHLGGAGETAMMYGLYNPNAGFFVIEDQKTGKVLAQAETWEKDENTLVFDNIEFADDRKVGQFAPILAKWAKEVDYEDVFMGTGYNEMAYGDGIRIRPGIEPPEIKELDADEVYSDADETVAVVKQDGEVEPYFKKAYEEKEHRPLYEEKTSSLPSLDDILGDAESKQNSHTDSFVREIREEDISM